MADYNFPPFLMKRVRYFNGQFLKDNEFVDDQKYHIDRRRRHERLLHVAGITEGLGVSAAPDGRSVTINPGAALDSQGRQILLEKATQLTIPAGSTGTLFVEIAYRELESDPSDEKSTVKGNTRFVLDPLVALKPQRTADTLLLAELPINATTSTTGAPVVTSRVYSGVRFPGPTSAELSLRARADGRGVALSGALSVAGLLEATSAAIAGDLSTRTITAAPGGVLTINSETSVSGGMAIARSLNVTGDVGLGGALFVARNITASADVGITGGLNVGRGMGVAADASIGGQLVVGKTLTSQGLINANAGLNVTGLIQWGDSMTRTESRRDAGLRGDQGARSGFFQTNAPLNFPAGAVDWWHLLDIRHSNNDNNFAMQLAGSFHDQRLWFRKTQNNPSMPWQQVALADADGRIRENGVLLFDKYAPRDRVISGGRNFFAIMQDDSNFVVARTNGQALWSSLGGTVSDGRLKRDIEPIEGALDKLAGLRGVSFLWDEDAMGVGRDLGVIAQEVEAVFPEAVTTMNDRKLVQYDKLVPVLIEAVKEQQQRIKNLESRLAQLGGNA